MFFLQVNSILLLIYLYLLYYLLYIIINKYAHFLTNINILEKEDNIEGLFSKRF
jgi:hypothetical protein